MSFFNGFQALIYRFAEYITETQSTWSSPLRLDSLQLESLDVMQLNWFSFNNLQPLMDSTSVNPPLQPYQPGLNSLQLNTLNLMQSNWFSFNDLQSLIDSVSVYSSIQSLQPGFNNVSSSFNTSMQLNWFKSEYQQWTASAIRNQLKQSSQPEFVWMNPRWSNFNNLV